MYQALSSATSLECATSSENADSQSEHTNLPNDLGSLLKPSMSTTDICSQHCKFLESGVKI